MTLRNKFSLPDSAPHVAEQLLDKSWGDLEVLESSGYLLFPAEIRKRKTDGSFEAIPVRLRVPREPDLRAARVEARKAALDANLDLERDRDLIQDLEDIHILCKAMRSHEPPHEEFDPFPEHFEQFYYRASIMALLDQLENLSQLVNPRPDAIQDDEVMPLVMAIAEERNISPLAVYGPDAQAGFVLTMVDQLVNCMEQKSSSESSEP